MNNKKPVLIKNWDELKSIPQESDTHILEIDRWSGWLEPKNEVKNSFEGYYYLSTHTFYEGNYKESSRILQQCGFNVELDNWDKDKKEGGVNK